MQPYRILTNSVGLLNILTKISLLISERIKEHERKTPFLYWPYQSRPNSGNVDTDKMDIPVCAKILADHDLLYASWDGNNSCLSAFQPDIKRHG